MDPRVSNEASTAKYLHSEPRASGLPPDPSEATKEDLDIMEKAMSEDANTEGEAEKDDVEKQIHDTFFNMMMKSMQNSMKKLEEDMKD